MLKLLILLICLQRVLCLIDPGSVGIGIAIGAWVYNYYNNNIYPYRAELCTPDYIPADINGLKRALEKNVYGQHIVLNQLIPALRSHFANGEKSQKPLVISFHGTQGTGKNYVSDFITKYIYKNGLNSSFVHKFVGRSDFPIETESNKYKLQLNQRIKTSVSKCPWSLFIFDEVDKMPQGVFDYITSFLDHHHHIDGVNYRNAIFIFLSNTAGEEMKKHLGNLMFKGVNREDTSLKDFENILEAGAYNREGGLQKASIIEANLIDHYIPFLPLERSHVERCVRAEYARLERFDVDKRKVSKIIDDYVTFDKEAGLFAKNGCKRLNKKVEVDVLG